MPPASRDAFTAALSDDGALLDAFGRPVHYEVKGRSKLASYRLRSLGFDGVQSDDDLCVSGQTRLQAALDIMLDVKELVRLAKLENASWTEKLGRVRAASCARRPHSGSRNAAPCRPASPTGGHMARPGGTAAERCATLERRSTLVPF